MKRINKELTAAIAKQLGLKNPNVIKQKGCVQSGARGTYSSKGMVADLGLGPRSGPAS